MYGRPDPKEGEIFYLAGWPEHRYQCRCAASRYEESCADACGGTGYVVEYGCDCEECVERKTEYNLAEEWSEELPAREVTRAQWYAANPHPMTVALRTHTARVMGGVRGEYDRESELERLAPLDEEDTTAWD